MLTLFRAVNNRNKNRGVRKDPFFRCGICLGVAVVRG